MHNAYRLVKGRDRCTLLIHPEDAAQIGLKDQEEAQVSSRVGSLMIKVELSDAIMPGVVSIPHGWGHHRKNTQLEVAEQHAGISINDLTDERRIDTLTGNAAFSGVPVKVEWVKA